MRFKALLGFLKCIMGIYLSQPCTHVELEAGVGPTTNFGVGTMQVGAFTRR